MLLFKDLLNSIILIEYFPLFLFNITNFFQAIWKNQLGEQHYVEFV